ncbi:hypothetical protein [Methanolapillus ohkumae]
MIHEKCMLFNPEFQSTLKETSEDTKAKEFMTTCSMDAINFDKIMQCYANQIRCPIPKSCDSLVVRNDELYLIEFKNGKIDDEVNMNIKLKIYESLLVLLDVVEKNIRYSREHVHLILVYNESKFHPSKQFKKYRKSKAFIGKKISSYAEKPFIQFGLNNFQNFHFKTVNTYTQQEFEENFVNMISSSS